MFSPIYFPQNLTKDVFYLLQNLCFNDDINILGGNIMMNEVERVVSDKLIYCVFIPQEIQ